MTKNLNDFKIEPNPNIPTDQKLIGLLKRAYTGDLHCYKALIKFDAIKPFSNYTPEITKKDLDRFAQEEERKEFHYIFVYQDEEKFIMSDDYSAYNCYKIMGYKEIPCVVLGEPTGESILLKGNPFLLEPPQIKIVKK